MPTDAPMLRSRLSRLDPSVRYCGGIVANAVVYDSAQRDSVSFGGAAGTRVVDTARTAFTDAMRAMAVFGMAMMLLAAWMAARLMRDGEGAAHGMAVADDTAGA